jgi:hypothetical protein
MKIMTKTLCWRHTTSSCADSHSCFGVTLLMRCSQCCEYFSVVLPDVQLAVTEQRVRSWAAAAAQLQVQITVLNPSAPEAAKKPAGAAAAGGTKGPPAPAPAATGTLLVNCAGLLVGDTSAAYLWGKPPPAAAVQDAASREGSAAAAVAVASVHAPVQQAAAGQTAKFKWQVQAPNGTLQEWLESAEVQVQVRP